MIIYILSLSFQICQLHIIMQNQQIKNNSASKTSGTKFAKSTKTTPASKPIKQDQNQQK